jgi:hypothetical protein
MLSNPGIDVDQILALWLPLVIGARTSLLVAMDWTDFDADNQATIMLSLITEHGRATPLVWLTVHKAELKDRRSLHERRVLVRLAEIAPAGVGVCSVADRGFGDQNLYRLLTGELHFEYVIRFRRNIKVTAASGVTRSAAAWVCPSGRARVLRGAMVTADRYPVGTVVCVRDPEMKQAWCLAASSTEATAKDLTGYYGSRWGIEAGLRECSRQNKGQFIAPGNVMDDAGEPRSHCAAPHQRDRDAAKDGVVMRSLGDLRDDPLATDKTCTPSPVTRRSPAPPARDRVRRRLPFQDFVDPVARVISDRLQIVERPRCVVPQLDRAERERFDRPAARTPSENWKRLCPLARRIASARVIRPIKRARQWTGRSELPTGSAPMRCWADRTVISPARRGYLRLLRGYRRTNRPSPVRGAADCHAGNRSTSQAGASRDLTLLLRYSAALDWSFLLA